jgi:hypothetical protein
MAAPLALDYLSVPAIGMHFASQLINANNEFLMMKALSDSHSAPLRRR